MDKKIYKGTNPSCHDFNQTVAVPDGAPLLVGFTTGQIQLVLPSKREQGRLFNEDVCDLSFRFFFVQFVSMCLAIIFLRNFCFSFRDL